MEIAVCASDVVEAPAPAAVDTPPVLLAEKSASDSVAAKALEPAAAAAPSESPANASSTTYVDAAHATPSPAMALAAAATAARLADTVDSSAVKKAMARNSAVIAEWSALLVTRNAASAVVQEGGEGASAAAATVAAATARIAVLDRALLLGVTALAHLFDAPAPASVSLDKDVVGRLFAYDELPDRLRAQVWPQRWLEVEGRKLDEALAFHAKLAAEKRQATASPAPAAGEAATEAAAETAVKLGADASASSDAGAGTHEAVQPAISTLVQRRAEQSAPAQMSVDEMSVPAPPPLQDASVALPVPVVAVSGATASPLQSEAMPADDAVATS